MDNLLKKYPIVKSHQEVIDIIISENKKYFTFILAKELNLDIDEQNTAEFCQVFFYICLDLDKYLPKINQMLATIIKEHMNKQIATSSKFLISVAQENHDRGIPEDKIIPYMLLLFNNSYTKYFTNTKLIGWK